MFSTMRWICATMTILLVAISALAGPLPSYDAAVQNLNEGNFTEATDRGMWFIEYYSPYCGHCKKFAPTWHELAEDNKHLEDSSEFHLARVNCIAQGDLCVQQNIDAYPSIELYRDGSWIETYNGDRSYDELERYIQARAADNRKYIAMAQHLTGQH